MRKVKKILRTWSMWGFPLVVLILGLTSLWITEVRAETKFNAAIVPFFIERGEDPARGAICPVCKGIYGKGNVLPGAENTLTRLLQEKMEGMGIFKILPMEKVEEALLKSDSRQLAINPVRASVQLGKTTNVDFIFVGFLFRFEERIGSSIGVEKPASVGFDVHLIRLRDEKAVWAGKFHETQRPLSENLLKMGSFIRRKASWLTAGELSKVGMDEILMHFPGPKELEEMP